MDRIVTFKNVWVEIEGHVILEDHTFSIMQDDVLGVIGPNGGGKTTLLKVMLGLIKPSRGEVRVFGRTPLKGEENVGYVPQLNVHDRTFPISVFDVVLMGRLSCKGLFARYGVQDHGLVEEALLRVGMWDHRQRQIGSLSGGEYQRVLIARALVGRPKLLLLDEPTASVDPHMTSGIYDLLGELKKDMAIVLVTHDMGAVSRHVDQIACLSGRLHYHDNKEITAETLEQVYHCPVDLIAHGVPHRILKEHDHEGCDHA